MGTYEIRGVRSEVEHWDRAVDSHNGCFCAHKKRQNLRYEVCHFTFMNGHNVHR